MKLSRAKTMILPLSSRPARGAWVEISTSRADVIVIGGRAPQGARGLKFRDGRGYFRAARVAPRKGRVG